MSDFSLMDAIECGIVKLPRVPVADNIPGGDMPKYRALWENIRRDMPKRGRGKAGSLDPTRICPLSYQTALDALYGHYKEDLRRVGQTRRRPTVLHRSVQQHLYLEARLRLHIRLPTAKTPTAPAHAGARDDWPCSGTSTSTATRFLYPALF